MKGGTLANIKKIEGGPFGDKKNFETKKMRNLNSLIVPKYLKGETLWAFWHFCLLQNIRKHLKMGPFEGKKIEKNVTQPQKN